MKRTYNFWIHIVFGVTIIASKSHSASTLENQSCIFDVARINVSSSSCIKMTDQQLKLQCLRDLFPKDVKVEVISTTGYIVLDLSKSACIGDMTASPKQSPLLLVYDEKGALFSLSNFKDPIRAGKMSFINDICFGADGRPSVDLDDKLRFLPKHSAISISDLFCPGKGLIRPVEFSVLEPVSICSIEFPIGQVFNRSQGRYSYTSSFNGKIKKGSEQISIKKGDRYEVTETPAGTCEWVLRNSKAP